MVFKIPNIRHLRVFLEVVECKSISKASDKVFLSQPAITQAIAKLEDALSTSFFQRRSDGMFVTESGRVFASRVIRAIEIILIGLNRAIRLGGNKSSQAGYLLQMLTTTQLRALIAVSEAKNFTIAGRNLGISQSALHRAARELESLLNVVLFEKTSTGINSSKSARVLAKATKLAFSELSQGLDEVNWIHNREVGQIVIGAMPLAKTSVLPQAIIHFSKHYPDIKIKVNDGTYEDLLYHLRHGGIDLLIGALRFPVPSEDVQQEELFSSSLTIVARPDHPLCHTEQVDIDALSLYPWVIPQLGTPTRTIFESAFTEAGLEVPKRLVETGSHILMRSLLLGSDRLAMISKHQIRHELAMGMIKTVGFQFEHSSRPIGISSRRSWEPTATQSAFIAMLRGNDPEGNDPEGLDQQNLAHMTVRENTYEQA